jgi:hypothetical protein
MDRFDRQFNFVRGIIVFFFILMAGFFVYRLAHVASSNSKMYNITIPSMSGTAPTDYFATEYVEENGCITFKDEFGFEHKHCGPYTVSKW